MVGVVSIGTPAVIIVEAGVLTPNELAGHLSFILSTDSRHPGLVSESRAIRHPSYPPSLEELGWNIHLTTSQILSDTLTKTVYA